MSLQESMHDPPISALRTIKPDMALNGQQQVFQSTDKPWVSLSNAAERVVFYHDHHVNQTRVVAHVNLVRFTFRPFAMVANDSTKASNPDASIEAGGALEHVHLQSTGWYQQANRKEDEAEGQGAPDDDPNSHW
mmetsp:Transcript_24015/g.94582  ORF Transcript_24015/g.94582 Transcript_24015/m.94582 type:complete len:134 (-) Transcript_24015:815-1216(-)